MVNLGRVAPVRTCECGRTFVGEVAWLSGDRRGADTYHGGRGLCAACYSRTRRRERGMKPRKQSAPPAPPIDREELLEEYDMIRARVSSIREAAKIMGMPFTQVDKALYRARRAGDERARPPQSQRLRAEERGRPFGRIHPWKKAA